MAGLSAIIFAVLSSLALALSAFGQCVTQLDSSTCLQLYFPQHGYDCLHMAQLKEQAWGRGCNAYAFVPYRGAIACLIKREKCLATNVNALGVPLDACSADFVIAAERYPYQCSGPNMSPPTDPPPATIPNDATPTFDKLCTFLACGAIAHPVPTSADCDKMVASFVEVSGTDCSAWSYTFYEARSSCYIQFTADDSPCSVLNNLTGVSVSVGTDNAATPEGECDGSVLPIDLFFGSSPCTLPPSLSDQAPPPPASPITSNLSPLPPATSAVPQSAATPNTGAPSPLPPANSAAPPPPSSDAVLQGVATGTTHALVLAVALACAIY